MKKQIAASVLAVAMAFTMLPISAFASAEDALIPTAETTSEASNAANPSAAETGINANGETAPSTTEDEPSQEEKAAETGSSTNGSPAPSATEDAPSQEDTSIAPFAETTYKVSTTDELDLALINIETRPETEATVVLTADVTLPSTLDGVNNISSFGASGKHITVKSAEGGMKKLSFASRCTLIGDCTFDNVIVTGGSLFCNGHKTIFTENGQIHLKGALYGGGYKETVDNTHVEIAASGYINPPLLHRHA